MVGEALLEVRLVIGMMFCLHPARKSCLEVMAMGVSQPCCITSPSCSKRGKTCEKVLYIEFQYRLAALHNL